MAVADEPGATGMPARGHCFAPHTADCVIEAWGPDRATCIAEAMTALVELFADCGATSVDRAVAVSAGPAPDVDLLVSLLEEVIYALDALESVPVHVHLAEASDGRVVGIMQVADAARVTQVGPVPKAVSYHGLEMVRADSGWRCRALVDV